MAFYRIRSSYTLRGMKSDLRIPFLRFVSTFHHSTHKSHSFDSRTIHGAAQPSHDETTRKCVRHMVFCRTRRSKFSSEEDVISSKDPQSPPHRPPRRARPLPPSPLSPPTLSPRPARAPGDSLPARTLSEREIAGNYRIAGAKNSPIARGCHPNC